jgi:hypothetical protein
MIAVTGLLLERGAATHAILLLLVADRRFALGAAIYETLFAAPGAVLELIGHPSARGRGPEKPAFRAKKHIPHLVSYKYFISL